MKRLLIGLLIAGFLMSVSGKPAYAVSYNSNFCTGGTPTASSAVGGYEASKAFDGDPSGTRWSASGGVSQWIKYYTGAGHIATKLYVLGRGSLGDSAFNAWVLEGSNNDSSWTQVASGNGTDTTNWQTFTFSNTVSYTYYRLTINSLINGPYSTFWEIQMMETVESVATVTTSAASSVETTTATGNGNITALGDAGTNCTRRGFCYMTGTSGDPTTANSVAYDDGSYGTGAYTKSITGLSAGSNYRVRAYAVNSAGTAYGTTVVLTTLTPSDTTPPTLSSTTPTSNATGVAVSGAISATFSEDMDSSTINTNTFTLSGGGSVSGTVSYSNKVATFTPSSNLSYSTTYTATITTGVKDLGDNAMSSNYTWSFTTGSAPDTTAPSGSVSINSGASYTNSTSVTLTLSATDSVGVVGYYASTSSSTPTTSASGWNSVTSTTSYTGSVSYSLASGDESKTVYVWYKDAAGNVSSAASDSIILDTTTPIVTITSPTSSDTYTTTSSPLDLSGSASDSTSGVKEVTWSNDKGGSGTASGTTYWSVSSISLTSGDNKITVTAKDNGGNTSTDTITVTYNAGSAPTVTTGSATNVTATSATITGTVNANGLSTTAWFEYGTVKGTYGNKTTTQTVTGSNDTTVSITVTGLTSGTTYYYRIAAQNNSGTSYGSEMSFQYSSPGSAPTVTTESATDVTTTTAMLNGTVNANGISTTAWFEYGTLSGTYGNKTTTKSVSGSTDTKVSIGISGLTSGTTYYYRIVAQNSAGTSYGKEMSFYYTTETKVPTVATEAATDVTNTSATLNGKCNPNGLSTTAWFEYGTLSGTYAYKTSTQSMSGSSYTNVSAAITGLTAGTTYYYRIVAKNSVGTSYGTEMEFYKSPGTDTTPTPVATPTPTTSPAPTLPPLPSPILQLSPTATPVGSSGSISGDVKDGDGNALQGVTVTIVGGERPFALTRECGNGCKWKI